MQIMRYARYRGFVIATLCIVNMLHRAQHLCCGNGAQHTNVWHCEYNQNANDIYRHLYKVHAIWKETKQNKSVL